ncbi:MAG TPA: hypothetical protein VLL25_07630 [Acidimicrobiales bacterium]|nr:hypothetical protein [Acidimicrobiales bacterium]
MDHDRRTDPLDGGRRLMAQMPTVEVVGLKGLRRDLIKIADDDIVKAFVDAGLKVAEPLVARIRAVLPFDTGELSGSARAAKVRTGATIRVGSARVPYAGPTEFGGYPGSRPFMAGGRYIFPTAAAYAQTAVDTYTQAVNDIFANYRWSNAP